MRFFLLLCAFTVSAQAEQVSTPDISHLVTAEQFKGYKDVADFIDDSPKVTITVPSSEKDLAEYGKGLVTTHTGSDCDRDGTMDDNAQCNAIYFKLWLKYAR